MDNRKLMPCGCIMEWEEGMFKLSLCRAHGLQYQQKEVIDYTPKGENNKKRVSGPYG